MKKLRTQILFTTLLALTNLPVMAQFVDIESPVKVSLRDVHFSDSQNGWAVGDSSTIINTIDGGLSWNIQQSPIGNLRLNRVQFLNEKVGYISAEKGVILSTQDGGTNWKSTIIDTMRDYKVLYFINADTGWIAGTGNWGNYVWGYSGQIQRTTDGGVTWEKQYGSDTLVTYPIEDDWFTDMKFISSQVGYAFAGVEETDLFSTKNGGLSWERIGHSNLSLYNIDVVFGDTIWGCGGGFASTTDYGINWNYNIIFGVFVSDLSMVSGLSGYVLTGRLDERQLLYTKDGGETFIGVNEAKNLYSFYLSPKYNFICAVGSNRIIVNRNFITEVNMDNLKTIDEFELHQNYPNPFNPSTTISYQIKETGNVRIKIYDALGREITTLVNKIKQPGNYSVTFNADNHSSGIYFVRMQANEFNATRKIILAK